MTPQRLIQNFRNSRGILWAGSDFNAEILERSLHRLGVSLVRFEEVVPLSLDPDRDIVFFDADQPITPTALIEAGSSLPAAPVIGLVGVEAPSRLRLLAEAGATAILRKPVQATSVYSVLFLGVNTYRRLRAAELQLADHARKRRGRRFIIKAVVALVQARGLTDDEAFAELRRESMRRRTGLEEFCEALFERDSSFPAAWPKAKAAFHPPTEPEEYGDASFSDDGGGLDGAPDAADRESCGSDQARRA
ncbi:ANTAR domain-containing response regulator [Lichenihabitans psoromatis]|uniref:ANTAR domain-containing response regulator n=1 Tax=Lichenihabitans psoromatis TaxID=2528642 RepID=UPI0010363211|nr:ANTAR domain-containing protein [Lichenihabitans psoromatis]